MKFVTFKATLCLKTGLIKKLSVTYWKNVSLQVIFKCCKLIPVMIGGVLIQGNYMKQLT